MQIDWKSGLFLLVALLLAGCCSVPNLYIPSAVGSLNDADNSTPLSASIELAKPAFIGEPIVFQAAIKNIGPTPMWIPSNPDLFFVWIYPDGRRDSFIYEPPSDRFYSRENAIYLQPGEQFIKLVTIQTYYFQQDGITEFRAYLRAGRNTNPDLNPFWNGELASNSYGVMLLGAKKIGASSTFTKKDVSLSPAS